MTSVAAGQSGAVQLRAAGAPVGFSRAWWAAFVPVPTVRLVMALAVVAVPVAFAPGWWPLLVGVLVAVALADAVLAPAPWSLPVHRDLPGVIVLGDEARLTWRVANPTRWPLRVDLADQLAPSLHASTRRVRLAIPVDARAAAAITLRPARRGRFDVVDLSVRVHGPLGLMTRQHVRSLPAVLHVHPTFPSRREAELRITRGRILEVGLRSARALGQGTEFESLREYGIDDEFRRIDWAATARRGGDPIVRTYRSERNQRVTILLDTGRLMAGVVAGVPRLDHAMDAAMALTTVATRLGDRAGLVAFSSSIRSQVPARGDRGQLARVTQAMFDLEPDLTESAYAEVFGRVVAQQRQRSLLVLLTELSSEAMAQTMIPALPLLLRRHLVLVGSVRDPEVEEWRTAEVEHVDDAFRAAGAVTVQRVRTRTAGLMQRLGATVVDQPPGRLAGALADAYLTMKARGRL